MLPNRVANVRARRRDKGAIRLIPEVMAGTVKRLGCD